MDQLKHKVGILFQLLANVGIVKALELLDNVINHFRIENAMRFEDAAVDRELVG